MRAGPMVAGTRRCDPGRVKSTTPSLLAPGPTDRVFYVESSIPPGLTVNEYRRGRSRRLTRWGRLKRLAGSGTAPAPA
jgi:hypothetical protein